MDIYEVLMNIDNKNKSFDEEMEGTTDECLFYNNTIVNFNEVEVNRCFGGIL